MSRFVGMPAASGRSRQRRRVRLDLGCRRRYSIPSFFIHFQRVIRLTPSSAATLVRLPPHCSSARWISLGCLVVAEASTLLCEAKGETLPVRLGGKHCSFKVPPWHTA